jgi:hypothetical protein
MPLATKGQRPLADVPRVELPDCHANKRLDGRYRGFRDGPAAGTPPTREQSAVTVRVIRVWAVTSDRGGLGRCVVRVHLGRPGFAVAV